MTDTLDRPSQADRRDGRREPVTLPDSHARAASWHARELGLDLDRYVKEAVEEKLLRDGRTA